MLARITRHLSVRPAWRDFPAHILLKVHLVGNRIFPGSKKGRRTAMKKNTALTIRIIGVFLSMLGVAIFFLLVLFWSVEEYATYSVPLWPMAFGVGIAVLGLICIKAGATSNYL
jgi:hypothetical protein